MPWALVRRLPAGSPGLPSLILAARNSASGAPAPPPPASLLAPCPHPAGGSHCPHPPPTPTAHHLGCPLMTAEHGLPARVLPPRGVHCRLPPPPPPALRSCFPVRKPRTWSDSAWPSPPGKVFAERSPQSAPWPDTLRNEPLHPVLETHPRENPAVESCLPLTQKPPVGLSGLLTLGRIHFREFHLKISSISK